MAEKDRTDSKMDGFMRKTKSSLLNMRMSQLISGVLAIVGVYILYRYIRGPGAPSLDAYGQYKFGQTKMEKHEMDKFMSVMKDTRPVKCLSQEKPHKQERVTIIIHFNEHQFYEAKLTIHSVIENTPADLFDDIILLDDGTSNIDIRREAQKFVDSERFAKKIRAVRSDSVSGESSSKFLAAKMAWGGILVYLSSRTVVNKGWLEPLLDAVQKDKNLIATPHVDNFVKGFRFYENKHNLINVFSWTLGTYYFERPHAQDKEDISFVKNPVLRGDAFVVRKDFLMDVIAGFDEGILNGGGEILELSLRTWLCGGQIKIVPCSRVVTHNALRPYEITNPATVRRIATLWFADYSDIVFDQTNVPKAMNEKEVLSLKLRQMYMKEVFDGHETTCKNMDWYLENVAQGLVIPGPNVRYFGTMQDDAKFCVHAKMLSGNEVDVVHCRPHTYDPNKIVEMTNSGSIVIGDKCLEVQEDGKVTLSMCNVHAEDQSWDISPEGWVHLKKESAQCLTHVSERDSKQELVHSLRMEKCQQDVREQIWRFNNY